MKQIYAFLTMLVVLMSMRTAAQAQQNKIAFGWNFFRLDNSINLSSAKTLFADSMQSSLYHCGNTDTVLTQSWASDIAPTQGQAIALNWGGAILKYSSSQRMQYGAVPWQYWFPVSDTLKKYYFTNHSSNDTGYDTSSLHHKTPPFQYWEIDTIPGNITHDNDTVLWGNQFPNTWYAPGSPLILAARLQLPDTNLTRSGDTNIILEVYAIHSKDSAGYSVAPYDTIRLSIRWDSIPLPGKDYTFFSRDTTFAHGFQPAQGEDFINIEVHSRRYTNVRLSFVCLLDTVSYNFTAGIDLSPSDSGLIKKHLYCDTLIWADSLAMYNQWNGQIKYYFIANEPPLTMGMNMGYTNQALGGRANTELNVPWWGSIEQYLAQVQPTVFWGAGGRTQCGYTYHCPYLDYPDSNLQGTGEYFYYDSTYQAWQKAKLRTMYVDSTCWGCFDPWETGQAGWLSTYLGDSWEMISGIYTCVPPLLMSNVASGLNLLKQYGVQCHWANVFNDAPINTYLGNFCCNEWAPTPEMLQFAANLGLLVGAKGILFSQGIGDQFHSGFVDSGIVYSSDNKIYNGNNLPVMYERLSLFGIRYSHFLNNVASVLANKQWLGGFARYPFPDWSSAIDGVYSTGVHNDAGGTLYIDSSADVMQRPIVDSFPSSVNSDSSWKALSWIYPNDTSKYHWITMPNNMRWLAEAFFAKDSTAITSANPLYIGIFPLYTDSRDLYARFDTLGDTGSFVRRADRLITTKLKMDSTVSKYWRVSDSAANWDTLILANASFTRLYHPTEMRIYKVEPGYSVTTSNANNTEWNNGRRVDYNGQYNTVVANNGHVIYTQSITESYRDDPLTGFEPPQTLDELPIYLDTSRVYLTSASYPAIRTYGNLVGVTYEAFKDSTEYVVFAFNPDYGSHDSWSSIVLDSFAAPNIETNYRDYYDATPVLCPLNLLLSPSDSAQGFEVAWSRGKSGIKLSSVLCTMSLIGTVSTIYATPRSDSALSVFPTLSERYMNASSTQNFDLAWQEWQPYGWSYIFGTKGAIAPTGSSDTITFPNAINNISAKTGCLSYHPNIDDIHTNFFGYAPRIVYESFQPSEKIIGDMVEVIDSTVIYTAVWIDSGFTFSLWSGWGGYTQLRSGNSANYHPSVHVFAADSIIADIEYFSVCGAMAEYLDIIKCVQPVQIGWYSPSHRLSTLAMAEGITHKDVVSESGKWDTVIMPAWFRYGHWTDIGSTPTLEINGRDTGAFFNQRELFLATDVQHARIPMLATLNHDTTIVSALLQVLSTETPYYCPANPPKIAMAVHIGTPVVGVTIGPSTGGLPLNSISLYADTMYPSLMRSGSFVISTSNDSIDYLTHGEESDTLTTKSWLGPYGKVSYMLSVNSATTNLPLMILDTLSYTMNHIIPHSDSGWIVMSDLMDSNVYIALTVDTQHITGAQFSGITLAEIYGEIPDSGGGFGKALNTDRFSVFPSGGNMQAYPNPFNPVASVAYQISPSEAGSVEVSIYDIMGRQISSLFNGVKTAGDYTVQVNATALGIPSGVYLIKIVTTSGVQMKQIVLAK